MIARHRLLLAATMLIALPVFGAEIPVTGADSRPAIARTAVVAGSGDSYVTVWTASDDRLFSRALDREGRPIGTTNLIDISAEEPQVVWIGDRYRVVFTASDHRFGAFDHVAIVDLDPMGRLIEGSRIELEERLYGQRVATDGDVTLVAGKSAEVDYTLEWFLIERSGAVRSGSIWIGRFFDTRAVYAREGDFGVLWTAGGGLYRFELFGGRVQAVSGPVGTYDATALGRVAWIATASQYGASVTLMDGSQIRVIKFESRPAAISGAYAMKEQVVIHAIVDDRHRLYRFADDGLLLQQFDMPPDIRTFSVAEGLDSVIAVSSRERILIAMSLPWDANGISDPTLEDVVSELAASKRRPSVASTADRTLVVWWEDRRDVATGEQLRGVIRDPSTGVLSDSFAIADFPTSGWCFASAVGPDFLVWIRTAQQEFRAVLIDPDGHILIDEFFAPEVPFVEDWAWTGDTYLAASTNFRTIFVTTWDGASTVSSREIGYAEEPGEDAWSAVDSSRVATGRDTVLVTWSSIVSNCFFPACYDPRQAFGRLLDRRTLEPVTEAFPIGQRDHYEDIETAWNGTHYGVWSESRGELFRLTESGELVDDEPIKLRGRTGQSFGPISSIEAVNGAFVVSWLEETWTHQSGVVSRVVYRDGSLSPLRAFPILTDDPSFSATSSGTELMLAYPTRVPDNVFLGAERIFVRTLNDVPLTLPPRAPRLSSAFRVGGNIALQWEDMSDDEVYFEIRASYDFRAGRCDRKIKPPDTTSAFVTCTGDGPFHFSVVGWNAAGYGEPSETLLAIPPERRHPTRR